MALPMVKERGISSILIENPYYGLRRPRKQLRSSLFHVSDLFVMGAALIMEAQVLLGWARAQGCAPLVCHGISMGGHMAGLAAAACPEPEPPPRVAPPGAPAAAPADGESLPAEPGLRPGWWRDSRSALPEGLPPGLPPG